MDVPTERAALLGVPSPLAIDDRPLPRCSSCGLVSEVSPCDECEMYDGGDGEYPR